MERFEADFAGATFLEDLNVAAIPFFPDFEHDGGDDMVTDESEGIGLQVKLKENLEGSFFVALHQSVKELRSGFGEGKFCVGNVLGESE